MLGDFEPDVAPDLSVREARPGDRWLLCSDGLSGFVSAETIADTMRTIADVDVCADRLVQLALRAGGGDNVTVIVADVVELDDVPDGTGPSTAASVVGSAASTRHRPTAAADGPAARAATLSKQAAAAARGDENGQRSDDPDDEDAPQDDVDPARRRRRRVMAALVSVLLIGVLGGAGYFGYRWTQTQYYVGVTDDVVTIYRGIPQTIGPITLSTALESSSMPAKDLPAYVRDRLDQTIPADSLQDARERVRMLEDDARTASVATG